MPWLRARCVQQLTSPPNVPSAAIEVRVHECKPMPAAAVASTGPLPQMCRPWGHPHCLHAWQLLAIGTAKCRQPVDIPMDSSMAATLFVEPLEPVQLLRHAGSRCSISASLSMLPSMGLTLLLDPMRFVSDTSGLLALAAQARARAEAVRSGRTAALGHGSAGHGRSPT